MKNKTESAGTFWQREPNENYIGNTEEPMFQVNCCDCQADVVLAPYFCHSSKIGTFISWVLRTRVLTVMYGPYCSDINEHKLQKWAQYIKRLGKEISATSIKIIPPFYLYAEKPEIKFLFDKVLDEQGFSSTEMYTVLLDMTQSKDEIFKKLKYETRRSVRRVSETGITVELLEDADHVQQWQNIKCRTNELSTKVIKSIVATKDDNCSYYVALNGQKALAWTGVKWGVDVGCLEGITTSPATRLSKSNRFANYALQWRVIEEGLKRGIKWLDYAGVEPKSNDNKLHNIMKFKLSWGGEVVNYSTYTYDLSKGKIRIIKLLTSVQKVMNKINLGDYFDSVKKKSNF